MNRKLNEIKGIRVATRMVAGFANRQLLHRKRVDPKAAIDALRAALSQYLHRFPASDASEPEAAVERLTVVEGPFDRYAANHWVDRYGFWRSAAMIHEWITVRRTPWHGPSASPAGCEPPKSLPAGLQEAANRI